MTEVKSNPFRVLTQKMDYFLNVYNGSIFGSIFFGRLDKLEEVSNVMQYNLPQEYHPQFLYCNTVRIGA